MSEVNIKDVAKKAGVSISTVSRVINSSKNVSTELKVRVEQAIEDMGYSTNTIARGLKVSRTKEVAVIITELNRSFFTKILEGINQEANKNGYQIFVMETHDSLEKEMQIVSNIAARWMDGIIIASSAYGHERSVRKYIEHLGNLQKREERIPVVSLEYDLEHPNINAVVVDHEKAAYNAVNHLIQAAGRKNIINVTLPRGHYMGEQRVKGYKRALEENGLEFPEECVLEGEYTTYSGYRVVKERLNKGSKFDGIFCANDQMAVGAIKACEESGLQVPEDVAVMGNDDIFVASLLKPSLSTIHVPRGRMGIHAMKRLIELIENKNGGNSKNRVITLDTEIIPRESTGSDAYNRMDWAELDW